MTPRLALHIATAALLLLTAERCTAMSSTITGVACGFSLTAKIVALTFDDGPNPNATPAILRILEKHHVRATFFVTGIRAEEYPGILKEIAARGHVIGNHTYSHPRSLETITPEQVEHEIHQCGDVVERITGTRPHLFRPPGGFLNEQTAAIAHMENCETVLWTVCADHHDAKTPDLMAKRVIYAATPGCVILVHDATRLSRTNGVEATRLIVVGLLRKGYSFVTLPELLSRAKFSTVHNAEPTDKHSPHSREAHRG